MKTVPYPGATGQKFRILKMPHDTPLFKRLYELGWTENACGYVYMRAPLGDPAALFVNGSVFAVRNKDLEKIVFQSEESEKCP